MDEEDEVTLIRFIKKIRRKEPQAPEDRRAD